MKYLFGFAVCILFLGACNKSDNPPDPRVFSDFWEYEDPEQLGFDLDSLDLAIDRASKSPNLFALLVIRNDKIGLERYFRGRDAATLFHLRSITKNFTSAITGISLERGILSSIDDPVGNYLEDFRNDDKSKITLRHLLNMTSGLQWDEDAEVLPLIQYRYTDPVQNMSNRAVDHEPGTKFNYNSVSPHIVSNILSRETGQGYQAMAQEMLLDPLGIGESRWELDPQGEAWGGFGLQLMARDLAKFGLLYLHDGVWDGNQLVPRSWIEESSNAQVNFENSNGGYSFQWWTATNVGGLFYGQGYGGQALMLVPEKDMIIVVCQAHAVSADDHRTQWRRFADEIFPTLFRAAN